MKKGINPKKTLRTGQKQPVDERFLSSLRQNLIIYVKANPPLPTTVFEKNEAAMRRAWPSLILRPVPIVATFMALLLSGTAFAAQKSLPGNILYPVKLATEDIRVAVTPDPEAKAALQIGYIQERVTEIYKVLAAVSSSTPNPNLSAATDNLNNNLNRITYYAQNLQAKGDLEHALEVSENARASVNLYDTIVNPTNNPTPTSTSTRTRINSFQDNIETFVQNLKTAEGQQATAQGLESAAKDKINKAEDQLNNIQNQAEKINPRLLNQNIRDNIRQSLDQAKNILNQGKADFNKTNFRDSFDKADRVLDESSNVNALIQIAPQLTPSSQNDQNWWRQKDNKQNSGQDQNPNNDQQQSQSDQNQNNNGQDHSPKTQDTERQ